MSFEETRTELLTLLRQNSVFEGDFTLASGAKSRYYVDCKLTTLDPRGAWLVGESMHQLIRAEEAKRQVRVDSIGGLTMGADPIALAVSMFSQFAKDSNPYRSFAVRKTPKSHGQTKLIEGGYRQGDACVAIDDVVTKGESTITAIKAILQEGGKVAFAAVLVDREEGGRKRIEEMGIPVVALFQRKDIFPNEAGK